MSLVERIANRAAGGGAKTYGAQDIDGLEVHRFALNPERLAAQGLVAPHGRYQRLSAEIGAVRRQLMRELDMFASAAKPRRRLDRARRVLVTSANPGDGKTFTAINLALSGAFEEGVSTLLFEADYARPQIAARLDLPREHLNGERPCLFEAEDYPFRVVPAFLPPHLARRQETRERALHLLDALSDQDRNQIIIVDSPPVKAIANASFIAAVVDHVILVVGAGKSSPDDVNTTIHLLGAKDRVSLLLNRCRFPVNTSSYYSYYYDYNRVIDEGKPE